MQRDILVSASLLACNLADMSGEIARCERAGVDWIHFDVMDGHFVEQITYGAPVLKSLRSVTKKTLDVHLMVENPRSQIKFFADAGADLINIHYESKDDVAGCLREIRSLGKKSALAIKPQTPAEAIFDYIPLCDMILVMTVEPGYGGQGFIYETLPKIKVLRDYADANGFEKLDIQVDGGVNEKTGYSAVNAGANVLVAGTGLFKADDMKAVCEALKGNDK